MHLGFMRVTCVTHRSQEGLLCHAKGRHVVSQGSCPASKGVLVRHVGREGSASDNSAGRDRQVCVQSVSGTLGNGLVLPDPPVVSIVLLGLSSNITLLDEDLLA